MRTTSLGASVLATALLAACAQDAPAPTTSTLKPIAKPGNVTTAGPADPAGATCGLARFEAVAAQKLNAYRNAGARCGRAGSFASAAPVTWNAQLARAAALHTQDMAVHGYFEHQGRDGRDAAERVEAAGYHWGMSSENIALGATSIDEVMAMWIASPGHCANMMAADAREFGLACVAAPGGGQRYWTLVLARPL